MHVFCWSTDIWIVKNMQPFFRRKAVTTIALGLCVFFSLLIVSSQLLVHAHEMSDRERHELDRLSETLRERVSRSPYWTSLVIELAADGLLMARIRTLPEALCRIVPLPGSITITGGDTEVEWLLTKFPQQIVVDLPDKHYILCRLAHEV